MFTIRKQLIFYSVLFLFAPWWSPFLKQVGGKNMFIQADSFILLGCSVLIALLSERIISDKWLDRAASFLKKVLSPKLLWVWLVGVLALLIYVNRSVLHQFMNSADEHSCYFLAETLRMGKWWVTPHALSEFFDVVHVGNRDGKWFSVYPPGWPVLWALGINWNVQHYINPILSMLSLFFIYLTGKNLFGQTVGMAATLLTAITPFFVFTGASYFSHTTSLFTMSIFAFAYLKWRDAEMDSKQQVLWASLAALAIGYGLITRYLTMASFAAPFLIYRFWPVLRRKERLRKDHILAIGIILCFFAIIFWQNYSVTGELFKAPNRFDKSWERLGFRDFYTPIDGMIFIVARFFYLIQWAPPLLIAAYLFSLFGYKRKDEDVDTKLFRLAFFFPLIAYFFYFSWGGNQYGPRYYYEGFPFLIMSVCAWAAQHQHKGFRKALVGAVLVVLASNDYLFFKQRDYFGDVSRQRKALYVHAEETLEQPSLVFIRGFLGQRLVMATDDAIRNAPSLDSKILYAKDKLDENKKLINHYPDRAAYIGWFDREALEARLEKIK